MNKSKHLPDPELKDKILEIDKKFWDQYYKHERITCDICKKVSETKTYYSPNARCFAGEHGYIVNCLRCKETYTLNQYLAKAHKDAIGHAVARWEIGSTGYNFNCPYPPEKALKDIKKARREVYKKKEGERKKMNYLMKYGKFP